MFPSLPLIPKPVVLLSALIQTLPTHIYDQEAENTLLESLRLYSEELNVHNEIMTYDAEIMQITLELTHSQLAQDTRAQLLSYKAKLESERMAFEAQHAFDTRNPYILAIDHTAFHEAVRAGYPRIVERLLEINRLGAYHLVDFDSATQPYALPWFCPSHNIQNYDTILNIFRAHNINLTQSVVTKRNEQINLVSNVLHFSAHTYNVECFSFMVSQFPEISYGTMDAQSNNLVHAILAKNTTETCIPQLRVLSEQRPEEFAEAFKAINPVDKRHSLHYWAQNISHLTLEDNLTILTECAKHGMKNTEDGYSRTPMHYLMQHIATVPAETFCTIVDAYVEATQASYPRSLYVHAMYYQLRTGQTLPSYFVEHCIQKDPTIMDVTDRQGRSLLELTLLSALPNEHKASTALLLLSTPKGYAHYRNHQEALQPLIAQSSNEIKAIFKDYDELIATETHDAAEGLATLWSLRIDNEQLPTQTHNR